MAKKKQPGKASEKSSESEAVPASAAGGTVEPQNLDSLKYEFLAEDASCDVLVEFVELVSPASLSSTADDQSPLARLKAIAGEDPIRVFEQGAFAKSPFSAATVATMASPTLAMAVFEQSARYFTVTAASAGDAIEKAAEIQSELKDEVASVTPEPFAIPAIGPPGEEVPETSLPLPDFRNQQGYQLQGPNGVNAYAAWQYPGGDGQDVTIIDLEGGWRFSHEDLGNARFNLWDGEPKEVASWVEHGTAVAGIVGATSNDKGITGVAPGARLGFVSCFTEKKSRQQRIANQLAKAAQILRPGDVILIELQRPGPKSAFLARSDQVGYLPVSYWPDVRLAIQQCVISGIAVIEVAGNGGENLDSEIYEGRFDQSINDSGSIMVGAGAPPSGQFGPARSRLSFSNYGSRLDCQCWGESVTTTGYGDLWDGGGNPDRTYTMTFKGTSSAAPIVTGLVACLQGRHRMVTGRPISPWLLRSVLANFGWPQTDSPERAASQRIGPQPDLANLLQLFELAFD